MKLKVTVKCDSKLVVKTIVVSENCILSLLSDKMATEIDMLLAEKGAGSRNGYIVSIKDID